MLTRSNGSLDPAWSTLLHEYPDRFLVGFDFFVPEHYQPAYMQQMVNYYRDVLGQLEPDVAAMIAYGNAARLAPFAA